MAPLQPVRLRRATQAEIDAAWKTIHDNPDPVEPKRIRHKHPKKKLGQTPETPSRKPPPQSPAGKSLAQMKRRRKAKRGHR